MIPRLSTTLQGHVPDTWTPGNARAAAAATATTATTATTTTSTATNADVNTDVNGNANGYVYDLSTMWDQYKTTLPLLLSVFPDTMGPRLLNGLVALAHQWGEFPTGYTLDKDYARFDGQARGLAHHTLADGLYRNVSVAFDWELALELMTRTFTSTAEGQAFVANGSTFPLLTHTLDLAGAAFATSRVARHVGNTSLEREMLALSGNALNAYNKSSCLLDADGTYYEGTYHNYGFRLLPDMQSRIALCENVHQGAAAAAAPAAAPAAATRTVAATLTAAAAHGDTSSTSTHERNNAVPTTRNPISTSAHSAHSPPLPPWEGTSS